LSHHDQQVSDDQNQTEHEQMLPSNMLLLNLTRLIDVTFSTPTGFIANNQTRTKVSRCWIRMESGRNPSAAWGAMWPLHFRSIRLTPPS
jgi:hypothetical protein